MWKDNIIPIANSPTGETHKARVDKVYSIGVSSILKLNINRKIPIKIDNILGSNKELSKRLYLDL